MKPKTHPTPHSTPVQGEGDYKSAKRYNESVQSFVKEGKVQEAAKKAQPATPQVAKELQRAESEGLSHSKGEDPGDDRQAHKIS